MRKATDNLLHDHQHILLAMDALDRGITSASRGHASIELFELAYQFITVWADGAHYDKEELLFEALLAQPMPPAAFPIGCLNMEHDATRGQAARMRIALEAIRGGNTGEWFTLLDATIRYTTIIRLHLPKENIGFFPMSDMILTPEAQSHLLSRFEAIDRGLPSKIQDAATALHGKLVAGPQPRTPARVERTHVDKYPLYDERLAAALDQLHVEYSRR